MADAIIYERPWKDVSLSAKGDLREPYLRRIRSANYKLTKLEIYIKDFDDSTFPTSATITRTPASGTYFASNHVFEETGKKRVQWIKLIWYGDSADFPENYVYNVFIDFDDRREAKNR